MDQIQTPFIHQRDLAIMNVEAYEAPSSKLELYHLLDEGRAAVKAGQKCPLQEVMNDLNLP